MDPIHFGIVMVLNMCIGICTPPVGSVLFVGCSVSKLPINKIIKPMLPFYAVMVLVLAMVTYIPQISMALPRALATDAAFNGGTCRHIYRKGTSMKIKVSAGIIGAVLMLSASQSLGQ